jgi:hypothetical protein
MTATSADGRSTHGTSTPSVHLVNAVRWFGIGVGSAVVGLLPWIITGMRLPLQTLWGVDTAPDGMPVSLLPFSQYFLTLLAGIMVVGAAVAGLVMRIQRTGMGRIGFAAIITGVLLTQAIAIIQSTLTVQDGLRPGRESMFYLVAIVGSATAFFVTGALILVLVARMPRAGALLGLSVAAVALEWWFAALLVPDPVLASPTQFALLGALRWLPAIVCGAAIAWCALNTIGRGAAALLAIATITIGPILATAVSAAAGSRVLARYPAEMLEYGFQVFALQLGTADLLLRPAVATVVVATAGLALKAVLRRRAG